MKNWFLQKNDSDQKIIIMLAIFSSLLLLYTFLYLPIKRQNAQLQTSIADIENEITSMQNMAQQVARFSTNMPKAMTMDESQLMIVIEQIAKQQQIALTSIKSQSNNKVLVALNAVSFNAAMRWLDTLQTQHHISISHLTVEAEKNGLTNMTIMISH
jgi:type II secretory pathway component PulM